MAVDASWPLQRAIFEKLRSDDRIAAMIATDSGDRRAPPFGETRACGPIRFRRASARAWHSATFDGQEHDIELEIVGRPDAAELCNAVVAALHDADLTLPGHALIELEFVCSELREGAGPEEANGRAVFRALTVSD